MPLLTGKKNVGRNIKELMRSGRAQRQSIAIALSKAGLSNNNMMNEKMMMAKTKMYKEMNGKSAKKKAKKKKK